MPLIVVVTAKEPEQYKIEDCVEWKPRIVRYEKEVVW